MNQIKYQVKVSLIASRKKLTKKERKFNFTVLGFDFMIDCIGQVKLIEANTNPCLEEPCEYLTKLIARMLNDTFRITIDKIFTPNVNDILFCKHPP